MLWPEEMPPDTVICLSGADRLVPTDLVLLHLKAAKSSAKVCRFLHWCCTQDRVLKWNILASS